jgi:hypothetical protein
VALAPASAPAFDTNAATMPLTKRLRNFRSGAVIAITLGWLGSGRWGFFRWFSSSTFRLSLTALGCSRRATSLRRRLAISTLSSLFCAARFTSRPATGRRRDRSVNCRRWTSAALLMFTCTGRRRRAEPFRFRSSAPALRRNAFGTALIGSWSLSGSARRWATMFRRWRHFSLCSSGRTCRPGFRRSLPGSASASVAFDW